MSKFNIGDLVRVVNPGRSYSTYSAFFELNNAPISIAAKYAYGEALGRVYDVNDTAFEIRFVGKHEMSSLDLYIICAVNEMGPYYMVDEEGLDEWSRTYIIPVSFTVQADMVVNAKDLDDAIMKALSTDFPSIDESIEVSTGLRYGTVEAIANYSSNALLTRNHCDEDT